MTMVQINYVAKGAPVFDVGEAVSGSLWVLERALQTGYLWEKVRVVGGAYGARCGIGSSSGTFVCSSYRDPNITETLDAFTALPDHIIKLAETMTEREMTDAIIGTVGSIDSPQTNDQKGFTSLMRHITQVTPHSRQVARDHVIDCHHHRGEWISFANRLKQRLADQARIVVVSNEQKIERASTHTQFKKLAIFS
eukprot:c14687_g1_i2.p1 GENE.c14687_g1_i2~~c14687_g1_i2.p1  ORF type:complete len:195 (+),score=52.27 c14687_g1_i2:136-720(+)